MSLPLKSIKVYPIINIGQTKLLGIKSGIVLIPPVGAFRGQRPKGMS